MMVGNLVNRNRLREGEGEGRPARSFARGLLVALPLSLIAWAALIWAFL